MQTQTHTAMAEATRPQKIFRITLLLMLAWTLAVTGSMVWNFNIIEKHHISGALDRAKAVYQKDLAYRRWNASHGGVYVPITERTPANPYLSHIPDRDITTASGKKFTLMNPAYMTRQVHEIMDEEAGGIRGHITSLNPIRPENRADPWEAIALKMFENGEAEVSTIDRMPDGKMYLRYMHSMITEKPCLKCHAVQGYKVGDIRGGISVSVPIDEPLAAMAQEQSAITLGHGILWFLGIALLGFGGRRQTAASATLYKAFDTLHTSEGKYRTLIETAPVILLYISADGKILDINPAAEKLYGRTRNELMGKDYFELLLPKEAWEGVRQDMNKVLAGEPTTDYKNPVRAADGTVRIISWNADRLLDSEDNPSGIIAVGQDVTERNKAENALRESEQRYRRTMTSAEIGTWSWHIPSGRVDYNEVWGLIRGCQPDEVQPHVDSWKKGIHPDNWPAISDSLDDHFLRKTPFFQAEYQTRTKSGEWIWILGRGTVTRRSEDGSPVQMMGTEIDITARKMAEMALKASLTEKEVLLREIHHRVKNNMQIISAMLELQAGYSDDPRMHDFITDSQTRIRAMSLVHEELYRLESLNKIDFGEYVKDLVRNIQAQYPESTETHAVFLDTSDVVLSIDKAIPCGLIINELVTNIYKHAFPDHRKGKITITMHEDDNGMVTLQVKDDGVGLPADLDISADKSFGMYVVHSLVERQLQGKAEKMSGKTGTTFTITFGKDD